MKETNYKQVGEQIVKIVGKENILSMTHCATRLRFVVKDKEKINKSKFDDLPIVKGTFYSGGQFQVILGPSIADKVYISLSENDENKFEISEKLAVAPKNKFKYAIRILAGIFIDIMPGMVATGLFLGLKGIIFNDTVLGLFNTSVAEIPQSINVLVSVLTDTVFGFLPALIGYSSFKTFGGSPVIGFVIGLMLVNPLLPNAYQVADPNSGVEPIYVFNFIPLIGYQGSVITSIFLGYIGSKFEKVLRKKMPNALDLMFTPFLVISLITLSGLLIFGPILHYLETAIVFVVKSIINIPLGIGGFMIGFIYPLTVMTGMHHLFFLIESTMLGATGFNPLITVCAMFGFSNAAVCFAISLRVKKQNEKVMGIGSGVTQLLGVSEPALFGVTIRYGKRPILIMLLCSAGGGCVLSILGIQANSYGLAVILSPLMYLYSPYQLGMYILIGVLTFAVAFVLTTFLATPDKILQKEKEKADIQERLAKNVKDWTNEDKYRRLEDMNRVEKTYLKSRVKSSKLRHKFHIQPKYGLLNDPNGFAYFNNKYYLFNQWFPYGAVHGLKNWNLSTSSDLAIWKNKGAKITPNYDFESHGIFSGSSIVVDENMYIFYTGNRRDEKYNRFSSQCLAIMDSNEKIIKMDEPIIKSKPEGYTENFRDPKVIKFEEQYIMFVGAQRTNLTGCILVYKSNNLLKWDFIRELKTNLMEFGSMWECPDLISVDGHEIFMISGEDEKNENSQESHQALYSIGKYDYKTNSFDSHKKEFQLLDNGFDFYATQSTKTPEGDIIMIGWVGKPNMEYPTDDESWANCLSIPRKLSIKDAKLYQSPVESLKKLRTKNIVENHRLKNSKLNIESIKSKYYEFICDIKLDKGLAGIKFRVGENEFTKIYLDYDKKLISLDRNKSGINLQNGKQIKKIKYKLNEVKFHVFIDNSTVEIFINEGEHVMTAKIFPSDESDGFEIYSENGEASFDITKWDLK